MRLTKVQIAGYRSFRTQTTVHLDERITVLLGANDHGKSNFLAALEHLNAEVKFDYERDLNWDEDENKDEFPQIRYFLKADERETLIITREKQKEIRLSEIGEQISRSVKIREQLLQEISELENEAARDVETKEGDGGEQVQLPVDPELSDRMQLKRQQISEVQTELEDWARLNSVVRNVSVGEIEREKIESEVQRLSREGERLRADLLKASQRKAADFKTLEEARATEDTTAIAAAEKVARQAQEAHASASRSLAQIEEDIVHLNRHIQIFEENVNSSYQEKVAFVSSIVGEVPDFLAFERRGVNGALVYLDGEDLRQVPAYLRKLLPRVQIFSSVDKLPDEVNAKTIFSEEQAFMRGIFYYAGLEKDSWENIFIQNDHTTKQLEKAGKTLNAVLRRDWRQGKELDFWLQHRPESSIVLLISDPKVESRYVRISRRSSGFTHFFGLKTMLHSYEKEADASSYIWLFDEPGISLHPDGQHDLLQALDTISRQNQVIYTTHSLFMIDKNYPARHRLLAKKESGTQVDGKPFLGNWRTAIDALGLALPGTILFASHVLLVEGPADPILISAIIQKLSEAGLHDFDLNPLSIMPTEDAKYAVAIARILLESALSPRVVGLYDGDEGGKQRKAKLESVLEKENHISLAKGKTIEDYLPLFDALFVKAAAAYGARLVKGADEEKCESEVRRLLNDGTLQGSRVDQVLQAVKTAADLEEEPSKVGIARDYAVALLEYDQPLPKAEVEQAMKLVDHIQGVLRLPKRTTSQNEIIQASS